MTDPSTNTTQHWYFLSAVEARVPPKYSAFAILGDSITDGRGSYVNTNMQWPNLLFNRLRSSSASDQGSNNIAVLNQAAGGDRVLYDGNGPNTVSRVDRDVLA